MLIYFEINYIIFLLIIFYSIYLAQINIYFHSRENLLSINFYNLIIIININLDNLYIIMCIRFTKIFYKIQIIYYIVINLNIA